MALLCDNADVGAASHEELPELLGRHIALDERGVGLRATWRPAHGFINVSLWRDDRCVETFHLVPEAASDLVAFLARALAMGTPRPTGPDLRVVEPSVFTGESSRAAAPRRVSRVSRVRASIADGLASASARLRP